MISSYCTDLFPWKWGSSFGLKINPGKTKSMSIVNSSTTRQPWPNAIVLNGLPVEEVNQFTYLGGEICKNVGSDAGVDCRVRKAKVAFGILSQIHFQTALKFAYLKAMSYQFCCMAHALGKSPPNFLLTDALEAFFTFIGPVLYQM